MSADSSQIPWRTSTQITIETFGCDSLWTDIEGWDGSSTSGTYETSLLDLSKTYHAISYRKGKETLRDSIAIGVDAPTKEDILSYKIGPWRIIKLEFQSYPDGPWVESNLWECDLDNLIYYYLYPEKTSLYDIGDIPCEGETGDRTGYWYLESTNVLVKYQQLGHFSYWDIDTLNEEELVLVEHYDNGQSVRTTYDHP